MEDNIIGLGFDLSRFDSETQIVIKQLTSVYELGQRIGGNLIAPGSGGGFAELTQKVATLEGQVKTLADANEKLKTSLGGTTQKTKELTLEQAQLSEKTKQANADTRLQAKTLNEAERAAAQGIETVAKLKLQLDALTKNRDRNISILDPKALASANAQILNIKTTIDTIEQGGGNFRGNVGNYTAAVSVLKNSLGEATQQLTKLNEAQAEGVQKETALKAESDALTASINKQKQAIAEKQQQENKPGSTSTVTTQSGGTSVSNLTSSLNTNLAKQQQLQQEIVATTQSNNQYNK